MNTTKALTRIQTPPFCFKTRIRVPSIDQFHHFSAKLPLVSCSNTSTNKNLTIVHTSSPTIASDDVSSHVSQKPVQDNFEYLELYTEKVIYGCRFFAILAVWGSLVGSFLCFFKGCTYVFTSYQHYFLDRMKVVGYLVEATDIYLLGTVMLVFGMGLYELFISNLDKAKSMSVGEVPYRSNLFGLFTLKERPRWLEVKTVNELKTKIGHVIVMLLLIGLFDKSKKAVINSPLDLLYFAATVLLSSGSLYLLSKLNE